MNRPRRRPIVVEQERRDDAVMAQYDTADDAARYTESHDGSGPAARFFRSRIHLVWEILADHPGGDLLDVGCGPGMMVRELLDRRPRDFRITALDRSAAMVEACARQSGAEVRALVGRIENMPLPDESFDVVLALGVLEYADSAAALREIARVARPNALVLVTMLNPGNPYRLVQWHAYWPARRLVGAVETWLGVPSNRRHGLAETGIRAYRAKVLREMLAAVGLQPEDAAYFDVTLLVPPIHRMFGPWAGRRNPAPEDTISRGRRNWMGTAYLLAAHKPPQCGGRSHVPSRVGESAHSPGS